MSEDWIEAQVSIKISFHLNALIMEELGTMHQIFLTRIGLKRQIKPKQITGRKGRDSIENYSMLSKIAVLLKTRMNPQMNKKPLNLC